MNAKVHGVPRPQNWRRDVTQRRRRGREPKGSKKRPKPKKTFKGRKTDPLLWKAGRTLRMIRGAQ